MVFKPNKENNKISLKKSLFGILIVFLVVLGYLFQVNKIAIFGYDISRIQENLSELKLLNQSLKLKLSNFDNLANIESVKEALGLVEIGNVDYIDTQEPELSRAFGGGQSSASQGL